MNDITIKGTSGNIVTLQGAPDNYYVMQNSVAALQNSINIGIGNKSLEPVAVTNDHTDYSSINNPLVGIVDQPTNTTINNQYKYIVIANDEDVSATTNNVSLQAINTTVDDNITILAGRKSGFSYTADNDLALF